MRTPGPVYLGWKTAFALTFALAAAGAVGSSALAGKPVPPPPPPAPADPAIAYCDSHKAGGSTYGDLMVMNADGSNKRRVLSVGGASIFSPEWSPDGQTLVFWDGALKSLCTIRLDGTLLTPIVATADTYGGLAQPSWSPGSVPGVVGKSVPRIAYADDVPPVGGTSVTELFVVNSDGSDSTQLTSTPDVGEESPTWSPSGTRLAFAMYTNAAATNHRTVGIYDFTSNSFSFVTPGGALAGAEIWNTDWSKTNESKIAVSGTTLAGVSGVWILDLANLTQPVMVAINNATQPSWSRDDARIVYRGFNGIEVVNAVGGVDAGLATLSPTGSRPASRRNP